MAYSTTAPLVQTGVADLSASIFIRRGPRLTVLGCRLCGRRAVLAVKDDRLVNRLCRRVLADHRCEG